MHYRLSPLAAATTLGVASGALWLSQPSSHADASPAHLPAPEPDAPARKRAAYPRRRRPSSSQYKYLIAGGGAAAAAALHTIVSEATADNAGDTLLVAPRLLAEPVPPGDAAARAGGELGILGRCGLAGAAAGRAPAPRVELVVGPAVQAVDPVARTATLDSGEVVAYEKLLLATGGFCDEDALFRRICSREAQPLVGYAARGADKLERLAAAPRAVYADPPHVTVVGGSWAAAALAAEVVERGVAVTMSHSEPAYLARHLPKYASQEVLRRFRFAADDAEVSVDTLAYSALNYVNCAPVPAQFRRNALGGPAEEVEATVHVSTVFDAYDIMQFRSDLVLFAPTTLPSAAFVSNVPTDTAGRLVAGPELSVYSDVYAAGACLSGESVSNLAAWSRERAIATGVHAARNMLGAREPFVDIKPNRLEIDLPSLSLKLACVGDMDGGLETFGFFLASRDRDIPSCGGELLAGFMFYVRPVRQDRVQLMGACVWDGQHGYGSRVDLSLASDAAVKLMKEHEDFGDEDVDDGVYDRRSVEAMLRKFAEKQLRGRRKDECSTATQSDENETPESEDSTSDPPLPEENTAEVFVRSPRERFLRMHKSARLVPLRDSELLFVGDKSLGASAGSSAKERRDDAMHELFRKAREH